MVKNVTTSNNIIMLSPVTRKAAVFDVVSDVRSEFWNDSEFPPWTPSWTTAQLLL
jgi:hypothetical protein